MTAMAATVSDILDSRRKAGEAPLSLMAGLSVAAHLAFLGILVFMARPKPLPILPPSIRVGVISGQALVRRAGPASRTSPAKPQAPIAKPAQPMPAPVPEAAPKRPVIEKLSEQPKPSEKAMPLPDSKKKPSSPVTPAGVPGLFRPAPPIEHSGQKGSTAALPGPSVDLPAGQDSGNGLQMGTSVASFDSDFPFAYYIEQLQALISANWIKPDIPDGTFCVVNFRIQKTGQVTDVHVTTQSGLSHYDRSATRAIFAANPLPPLPPEFRGDSLGAHIRFQ